MALTINKTKVTKELKIKKKKSQGHKLCPFHFDESISSHNTSSSRKQYWHVKFKRKRGTMVLIRFSELPSFMGLEAWPVWQSTWQGFVDITRLLGTLPSGSKQSSSRDLSWFPPKVTISLVPESLWLPILPNDHSLSHVLLPHYHLPCAL